MKVLEVQGVVISFPEKTLSQRVITVWDELPPWRKVLFIQGLFLFTGIFSTLGNQLVYYNGAGDNRSLLPAAATFFGMCCAIFVPREELKEDSYYIVPYGKIILMGFLEFFGCVFAMLGLNCAGSGVFQVVYASIVIWIALLSKWFLNKRLSSQYWTAVFITTFGVSLSAIGSFSSGSINAIQLLGITLTLLSTFSYGSNYIVSEYILSVTNPPPSMVIQMYTGITGFLLVFSYIIFFTIPNWNILVSENIRSVKGSIAVIIITYIGLAISSFLHSWSYFKLVKQTGSVGTGILQSLRAIFVFILSSVCFCSNHPEQCINTPKIASAIVVVVGVTYFSYLQKLELSSKLSKDKNETIHV